MNTAFVQPRFTGTRYEKHTLPVEVARDLAAYEALLLALAKHLYLQDHPDRQRVPKGFPDAHLDIVSIEEGSSKTVLALVTAATLVSSPVQLTLLPQNEENYCSKARDLIAECIAAPDSALPANFPKELLSHFNQLGRSLRDGEAMELPQTGKTQVAVLDSAKRKKLVLAGNAIYERELELSGFIDEADWKNSTLRLDNQATVPIPAMYHDKVRQSWGKTRDRVLVKCVAEYDSEDSLKKIINVESFEIIKNYILTLRFDEILQLEDGWCDGIGVAPKGEHFQSIAKMMIDSYPENVPLPTIIPTQTGNLLLEWNTIGDPSVDITLDTLQASFHAFGQNETDIEADFFLTDAQSYAAFFVFLSENIKAEAV